MEPLKLQIEKRSTTPIYAQLNQQIRLLIHRGVLQPGDAMPTVRALAVELGINANTVARVYRDLQRESLLRLERGLGTFVDTVDDEQVVPADFRALEAKARELVQLGRDAGLRCGELTQLIKSTWKETRDAQG